MRDAKRPAGPGQAKNEERASAAEREEFDEMADERMGGTDEGSSDKQRSVQHAVRDAHVKGQNAHTARGVGGQRGQR